MRKEEAAGGWGGVSGFAGVGMDHRSYSMGQEKVAAGYFGGGVVKKTKLGKGLLGSGYGGQLCLPVLLIEVLY